MPLPYRRVTPQPRPQPVRPKRVAPAPLASPQAKPTLVTRGHVWIPRPRITSSRLVTPAPLASPQAKATFAVRGRTWIPRPRITASRLVRPAPVVAAAPIASIVLVGIRRPRLARTTWPFPQVVSVPPPPRPAVPSTAVAEQKPSPVRRLPSRLIVPPSVVAA